MDVESIVNAPKREWLRWYGHVLQKSDMDWVKKVMLEEASWRNTGALSGKRTQKIVKNEECLGTQPANPCGNRENHRKMRRC